MASMTSEEVRVLVHLLHRKLGHPRFQFERLSPEDSRYESHYPLREPGRDPACANRVERGIVWFSRRLDLLSKRWETAQTRTPAWAKRLLDWLQSHQPADESLLRALCSAEAVRVEYPESWSEARAMRRWTHVLRQGRRRHLIRLIIMTVALPISVLLTVVPGPNVLGFWITYRVISHGLSFLGAGRALQSTIPVALVAYPEPPRRKSRLRRQRKGLPIENLSPRGALGGLSN